MNLKAKEGLSVSDMIVVGFALFSMFFGAGNTVFPPYIGMESGTSWFTGFLIIQRQITQNSTAVVQTIGFIGGLKCTGVVQRLKMLIIHLHGILPKLPIQLFRARTIAKPLNEFGTVLPRNINCACVVVDHVKFLGDRAERIQRAAASAFKRVDHADFVNRGTVQLAQFAEIALHCLRRSCPP